MTEYNQRIMDVVSAIGTPQAETVVFSYSHQGRSLLALIGLEARQLTEACHHILANYNTATPNDARTYSGTIAYLSAVRHLRNTLAPEWKGKLVNHLELLIKANDQNVRMLPSSGNKDVGVPERSPQTKNNKGESTKSAIASNQLVFSFIKDASPPPDKATTFIFLYYVDPKSKEMRAELSLPVAIDPQNSKVSGWSLRIILPSIKFGENTPLPETSDTPNTDFKIERRNG